MKKNEKKSKSKRELHLSPGVEKFISENSLRATMAMRLMLGKNPEHLERFTDFVVEGAKGKQYLIREICEVYEK